MTSRTMSMSLFLCGALAAGCVPTAGDGNGASASSNVAIGASDQPDRLAGLPGEVAGAFSFKLADNVTANDVGHTFGVDDGHIPYPDTYWPMTQGGIDAQWSDPMSPLAKYLTVASPSDLAAGEAWEQNNHGPKVPGVASWWGHCPGWTGASLSNAPIQHAVSVTSDGSMTSCTAGTDGCITFQIGDINALEAEVYVDADMRFIGNRCDTAAADIKRDGAGRIENAGCGGLNPGALLVVAGNLMKGQHRGFAIDAQNDFNTDQIWNQPAYRYTVNRYNPLTSAQAANMVATGTLTGDQTSYQWNNAAKGFAFVDLSLQWVSENGPNLQPVSGTGSTQETRVTAVIELDADPADANASIIGGEYVQDSSVQTDRLTVPPFVWVPNGTGPEDLSTSVDGNSHNPYVKPSIVKKLIALGQQ